MKDPRDAGTIDGFADLLEALEDAPKEEAKPMHDPYAPTKITPEKMAILVGQIEKGLREGTLFKPKRGVGRPPKGKQAQTPAEKQKAYRDRKRAERDAAQ